jgi:hypothetical protein
MWLASFDPGKVLTPQKEVARFAKTPKSRFCGKDHPWRRGTAQPHALTGLRRDSEPLGRKRGTWVGSMT